MSDTYMTMPGKIGDAIHQTPIPFWWAKENGKQVNLWLDKGTLAPLVPLFEAQSWVGAVELIGGIESYNCGGQPWHFDVSAPDKEVFHLGLRAFPDRQLTLVCRDQCKVMLQVDQQTMAETPCFETAPGEKHNRLLLHGQAIYAHTKATPTFWKFLANVRGELENLFEEIVFVGTERDREVGLRTYPEWQSFDDHGSFKELADYMATSEAVIGTGSSGVALAGALKVPCIRVHDPIGENSRIIWDNLGSSQLNRTEIELRKDWPTWRDKWLKVPVG